MQHNNMIKFTRQGLRHCLFYRSAHASNSMPILLPYWLYQFAALLIHEIVFLDATISIIRGILCKKYLFLVKTRALDDNSSSGSMPSF